MSHLAHTAVPSRPQVVRSRVRAVVVGFLLGVALTATLLDQLIGRNLRRLARSDFDVRSRISTGSLERRRRPERSARPQLFGNSRHLNARGAVPFSRAVRFAVARSVREEPLPSLAR